MKKIKNVLLISASILTILPLSGCGDSPTTSIVESNKIASSISVIGQETIKETYTIGEIINLSGLYVVINYDDNSSSDAISVLDDRVTVSGIDTDTLGSKAIVIQYGDLNPVTIPYNVREKKATLNFNGGSYNDQTEMEISSTNNEYNISGIEPTSNDSSKIFAGWFLDEELTQRVDYTTDGYVEGDDGLVLYAGYDIDYKDIFNYEIDKQNKTCKIVGVNNESGVIFELEELYIPKTIELYPVVEIGDHLLEYYDEWFGEYTSLSFLLENIKSVVFDKDSYVKTIGDNAFTYLQMENVILPQSLTTIGNYAFESCYHLKSISIPENVERIGSNAFANCSKVLTLDFVNYGALKYIGESAFRYCDNIDKLELPEGLEVLMPYSFSDCSAIRTISIPSTVSQIGLHSFKNLNQLYAINVSEKNNQYCSIDGNLYNKDVTKIIRYCFGKYEKVFTMPETVTSIEESAFNNENGYNTLEELVLSPNLKEIYDDAFAGCYAKMKLPESLEKITSRSFYHYSGSSFDISKNNQYFSVDDQGILYNHDYTKLYSVPYNTNIEILNLDNRVVSIESYAIMKCRNLREINISSSSNLAEIKQYGAALHSMKFFYNLNIMKSEPFSLSDDAFAAPNDLESNVYNISIKDDCFEAYKDAWANYVDNSTIGGYDINNYLVKKSELKEKAIGSVSNTEYTSYAHYNKGVELYFNDSFDRIKYNVFNTLQELNALYKNLIDITNNQEMEYLINFETSIYKNALNYFNNNGNLFDLFDANFIVELITRYKYLPIAIKNSIESDYNGLNSVYTNYLTIKNQRADVIEKIRLFECSSTSFDIEKYEEIIQELKECDLENSIFASSINEKLNLMICSYKISQFISYNGNYLNHMDECNVLLNGFGEYYSVSYGILTYINELICDNYNSQRIYKLDEFYDCYRNYLNDVETYVHNKIELIENFNLNEDYNESKYYQIISEFNDLPFSITLEQATYEKYFTIIIIYNIHNFMNNYDEVNDKNFIEINRYIDEIDGIIDRIYYSSYITEQFSDLIDEYNAKKATAQTYLDNKYQTVKNDINNFDITSETFDNDAYNKLVADYNSLEEYAINLNYLDFMDDTDYTQMSNLIDIAYEINELVTNYDGVEITGENYRQIHSLIYGTIDSEGNKINGIYQQLSYLFIDDSVISSMHNYDKYLEILEKLNNF